MKDGADINRSGRKFDQVLSGAREVFLKQGFEGTSVDDVARAAGVSKATIYSYFPDKQFLFLEVARLECERLAEASVAEMSDAMPPATALRCVAERMLGFILSDFGQRVFRICVAGSDRFPQLGRSFYDSGPRLVRERLKTYFAAAERRGELRIPDPDMAADQFAELCKADLFPRLVFNIDTTFTEPEVARVIDEAIRTFLARYGAPDGAPGGR